MHKGIAFSLVAALVAASASAAEPRIVWRSTGTGVIAAEASPIEEPPGEVESPVTYQPLKVSVTGTTNVKPGAGINLQTVTVGGSGDFLFGLSFEYGAQAPRIDIDMTTGQITGAIPAKGTYNFLVSVYDRKTWRTVESPVITIRVQ